MFECVPDTSLLNYGPRVPLCPTCLMCLRADVRYVPAYRGAFASYVPSFFTNLKCHHFLRALRTFLFYLPYLPSSYVPHMLSIFNVPYVPSFFTCLRAFIFICLNCLYFIYVFCFSCMPSYC